MRLWNKILYNKYFNELYPIEDKLYMTELINNGAWKALPDSYSECIRDLTRVLKSEIISTDLDIEAYGRAKSKCLKNKKVVTKSRNENNKKVKSKKTVTVNKAGFGKLKDEYENEYTTLGEYKSNVESLLERVEKSTITSADFELLNYILYKNRFSISLGLAIFALFIVILFCFILATVNGGLISI